MKIFTPIVEHLKLQIRLNLKSRNVEIKVGGGRGRGREGEGEGEGGGGRGRGREKEEGPGKLGRPTGSKGEVVSYVIKLFRMLYLILNMRHVDIILI